MDISFRGVLRRTGYQFATDLHVGPSRIQILCELIRDRVFTIHLETRFIYSANDRWKESKEKVESIIYICQSLKIDEVESCNDEGC